MRKVLPIVSIFFICFNFSFTTPNELVTLYGGTPVYLKLNEAIKSSDLEVGHTVELLVTSNVMIQGKTLIAVGNIAEARVTKVVKSCGKRCKVSCPEIVLVAESVQAVDGQRVYLRSMPLQIMGDCYNGMPAEGKLGTKFSGRVLNNIKITIL